VRGRSCADADDKAVRTIAKAMSIVAKTLKAVFLNCFACIVLTFLLPEL
jgi:hypothetical protein